MKISNIWLLGAFSCLALLACTEKSNDLATVASDNPEHSEMVVRDLFAIISLQGEPCQKVVSYRIQDELDYVATCESGDRYRVHVSAEGNVNVKAHKRDD